METSKLKPEKTFYQIKTAKMNWPTKLWEKRKVSHGSVCNSSWKAAAQKNNGKNRHLQLLSLQLPEQMASLLYEPYLPDLSKCVVSTDMWPRNSHTAGWNLFRTLAYPQTLLELRVRNQLSFYWSNDTWLLWAKYRNLLFSNNMTSLLTTRTPSTTHMNQCHLQCNTAAFFAGFHIGQPEPTPADHIYILQLGSESCMIYYSSEIQSSKLKQNKQTSYCTPVKKLLQTYFLNPECSFQLSMY